MNTPTAVFEAWPRWAWMWALAFVIYATCKVLTWAISPIRSASGARQWGYLLAWPGLDAAAFLDTRQPRALAPAAREWLFAWSKLALGIVCFFGLARLVPADRPYLAGWVGMVGLIFMLHFGSFHLLSCAWRHAGVNAQPLMDWPLAATSVSDYWGKRWNRAFRDFAHRFGFRPLTPRLGVAAATMAVFLFSGVVHDAVISLPAGGGYGGPTLFFLAQGAGLFAERSTLGRKLRLGRDWRGRAFAMFVLLAPLVLLFHPPFVENVIVPMMRDLGALP